jgi:hypothetical protein
MKGGVGDNPHSASISSTFPYRLGAGSHAGLPRRFDPCKPDWLLFYLAFACVEQSATLAFASVGLVLTVTNRKKETQPMEQLDSIFMMAYVVFALPAAMILLGGDTTDDEQK